MAVTLIVKKSFYFFTIIIFFLDIKLYFLYNTITHISKTFLCFAPLGCIAEFIVGTFFINFF